MKKLIIISLISTLLIASGIGIWLLSRSDNSSNQEAVEQTTLEELDTNQDAETTSTVPTAQEDFTDGTDRQPGNTLRENRGSGSIQDTGGTAGSQTDESNWITSSTGEITTHQPIQNQRLSSGDTISGTSTLSQVQFRLIDNISGVIAQGSLNVSNGKFSGTLNFSTNATEGRLDIFGAKPDGVEFSNIEIPIRF